MSDLILSIDVGTSMIKAGCYSPDAELMAMGSSRSPDAQRGGVDPEAVWDSVCVAIADALSQTDASAINAVVVTGQGDGLWTIGNDGNAAGPAFQWNDARAEHIVSSWEADGTIERAYALNDTVMWPGTSAALWSWLRSADPGHAKRTKWIVCAPDWINYRLTGEVATDVGNAGIPFLDPDTLTWSDPLMDVLGCEDVAGRLPDVRTPGTLLGAVTAGASAATGLPKGTPVYVGSIDVVAMFRGLGIKDPGSVVAVLGTTAVALAVVDERPQGVEPVGATLPMPTPGQQLRVLGATSGTSTFDWYVSNFLGMSLERASFSAVLDEVESVRPEDATAMLLPFLAGERSPFLAPEATGTFVGITPTTTRSHMSYAVIEGITLALRHCVEAAVPDPGLVVLTGGGSTSTRWRQLAADVLGREIVVDHGEDRACLGAVSFVTGVDLGVPPEALSVQPRSSAVLEDRFARYVELTSLMRPAWRAFRGQQGDVQ